MNALADKHAFVIDRYINHDERHDQCHLCPGWPVCERTHSLKEQVDLSGERNLKDCQASVVYRFERPCVSNRSMVSATEEMWYALGLIFSSATTFHQFMLDSHLSHPYTWWFRGCQGETHLADTLTIRFEWRISHGYLRQMVFCLMPVSCS